MVTTVAGVNPKRETWESPICAVFVKDHLGGEDQDQVLLVEIFSKHLKNI